MKTLILLKWWTKHWNLVPRVIHSYNEQAINFSLCRFKVHIMTWKTNSTFPYSLSFESLIDKHNKKLCLIFCAIVYSLIFGLIIIMESKFVHVMCTKAFVVNVLAKLHTVLWYCMKLAKPDTILYMLARLLSAVLLYKAHKFREDNESYVNVLQYV